MGEHSWEGYGLTKDGHSGFMFDVSVERRPTGAPNGPSFPERDARQPGSLTEVEVILRDFKVSTCSRVISPGFSVEVYFAKGVRSYEVRVFLCLFSNLNTANLHD